MFIILGKHSILVFLQCFQLARQSGRNMTNTLSTMRRWCSQAQRLIPSSAATGASPSTPAATMSASSTTSGENINHRLMELWILHVIHHYLKSIFFINLAKLYTIHNKIWTSSTLFLYFSMCVLFLTNYSYMYHVP